MGKSCDWCGTSFSRYYREAFADFAARRFCSHGCRVRGRRRARAWNPDSSPYKRVNRDGRTTGLHRAVIEESLGRRLSSDEVVHHVNGDKTDNRAENLIVMSPTAHSQLHTRIHPVTKTCRACGVIFSPPAKRRKRTQTCSPQCRRSLLASLARAQHERQRAERGR